MKKIKTRIELACELAPDFKDLYQMLERHVSITGKNLILRQK